MNAVPTLRELRQSLDTGERSAVDIVNESLARIERLDPALHAFTTVTAEGALALAREIDGGRRTAANAPLLGVPVALKDNLCTRGVATTAGSRTLEHFVPPYDATVVARVAAAGAVLV